MRRISYVCTGIHLFIYIVCVFVWMPEPEQVPTTHRLMRTLGLNVMMLSSGIMLTNWDMLNIELVTLQHVPAFNQCSKSLVMVYSLNSMSTQNQYK